MQMYLKFLFHCEAILRIVLDIVLIAFLEIVTIVKHLAPLIQNLGLESNTSKNIKYCFAITDNENLRIALFCID